MSASHIERLLASAQTHHPRSIIGINESRASAPHDFERIANQYLSWCEMALGETALEKALGAFARFSSDVNIAQARYEATGHYEHKSFAQCNDEVYNSTEMMTEYLWGVYLSNFLWTHHLELMLFFEQRFIKRLDESVSIAEIAPGHGGWGLWALHQLKNATLIGFDISATSIQIASSLANVSGIATRAQYRQMDAMAIAQYPSAHAQACICCFLVEHLEQPEKLLQAMNHALKNDGFAFFTGALTAAQIDHIFEFKQESELYLLAEQAGFRVIESRSVAPSRLLRGAQYLPRSMALILQKTHSI